MPHTSSETISGHHDNKAYPNA